MEERWEIVKLAGGLGHHAAAWDALNQRRFRCNPMLHSRFVDALLKYFGTGEEYLCALGTDSAPQAMCVMEFRGSGIWTTFLPSQAQVGPTLIDNTDLLASLMRGLPGFVGAIDLLCHDTAYGDLPAGNTSSHSKDHALTMNIKLEGGFESYWAQRSKQLRQNMRRFERRIEEDLILPRFVCISNPVDISAAVVRYATLESKGWKAELGTAITVDNAQGHFYNSVMNRFAEFGCALVYELWFGDQLAASRLAIWSEGMIVILKATYDESLDKYAPGRMLLRDVIQSAFASHPGNVIEFYTDANADQLAWATGQRWIKHINFPRSAIAGSLSPLGRFGRRTVSPLQTDAGVDQSPPKVEVFHHLDQLPADVVALFEAAETDHIEFGTVWFCNLVTAVYPGHDGVRIYVVRAGAKPVAALVVLAQARALGNRVESLGNYYTAIYSPVVAENVKVSEMALLLSAIRTAHAPLGSLRFAPMDPKSPNYLLLREGLRAAKLVPFEFFCFGNWYLTVKGNWDAYLMSRTASLRSTIKRMSKKFLADGGTLELIQGGPDIGRGVAAYEQVYSASWKNAEPYPNFVQGLVNTCAERGWLRLGVAWLDSKPIAAQIWIVANGSADIYKVAYDENYKAYTPGTLVTAMLMQHVIETDAVTKVDYLQGDDPYKKTWMNERQERWGMIAYNPRSVRGLYGLGREVLGRKLKPWLVKMRARKMKTGE